MKKPAKEPQEEINRLMNEKLNADKMSLNPPLKFEPQEETYQTLENKVLEEFDKDYYRLEWHTPEEIKDFLKSHLQLAYNLGLKKGNEELVYKLQELQNK